MTRTHFTRFLSRRARSHVARGGDGARLLSSDDAIAREIVVTASSAHAGKSDVPVRNAQNIQILSLPCSKTRERWCSTMRCAMWPGSSGGIARAFDLFRFEASTQALTMSRLAARRRDQRRTCGHRAGRGLKVRRQASTAPFGRRLINLVSKRPARGLRHDRRSSQLSVDESMIVWRLARRSGAIYGRIVATNAMTAASLISGRKPNAFTSRRH